ncbi:Uncharacterised protein [Mycobacteroides abscessus subsp. abscessus]|jgi:hypothetical protein|uniref:hypothetical protein n=1 Tax=Mycobacteroides abscessus TaxID=36809 RepID=UPI000925FF59|nr:hypothetical protein [Mycobacteroides abscessus]SIH34286.1 Uncharacterised protein [Mycobacteroides abscessus subsp. abscessus]
MDPFWLNVNAALDKLQKCRTVDEALSVLNEHFDTQGCDAFFAGGSGDRTVWETLTEAGWQIIWSEADYFYVIEDLEGNVMTYIEGDVCRGDQRS